MNACFKAQDDLSVEIVSRHPSAPRIEHINSVKNESCFLWCLLPANCLLSFLCSNIMAIEFLQCSDVTQAMTVEQVCVLQNVIVLITNSIVDVFQVFEYVDA